MPSISVFSSELLPANQLRPYTSPPQLPSVRPLWLYFLNLQRFYSWSCSSSSLPKAGPAFYNLCCLQPFSLCASLSQRHSHHCLTHSFFLASFYIKIDKIYFKQNKMISHVQHNKKIHRTPNNHIQQAQRQQTRFEKGMEAAKLLYFQPQTARIQHQYNKNTKSPSFLLINNLLNHQSR